MDDRSYHFFPPVMLFTVDPLLAKKPENFRSLGPKSGPSPARLRLRAFVAVSSLYSRKTYIHTYMILVRDRRVNIRRVYY